MPQRLPNHRVMRSSPATLIIPVENQVRELDAKLLLACVAAERGLAVVIGSQPFVQFAMPSLRRGVFLAKSLRYNSALMLGLIQSLGHEIVAWDEESLVRYDSPDYYSWRFSPDTFRPLSHLFAWGPDDAEMFSAYPGANGVPVHVTGNPRADLLRPELRDYFADAADELREQHGDFILINTNFSFVNAFVPSLNLIQAAGTGPQVSRTGHGMSLEFARGMAAHQRAIHDHFRALLAELSAWFPERTIVLRPHPSEDHGAWERATADFANVRVLHSGNVVPWLLACRVLLHNGCTTAVEATLLGIPAVSYQPVMAASYDYYLPNALSHCAQTPAEVRELLIDILAGRVGQVAATVRNQILARHLAATSGELAADRVVDVLESAGLTTRRPPWPGMPQFLKGWVGGHLRTATKQINMRRPGHRNSAAYHAHRFPEISVAQVENRVGRLRTLLGRFQGVHVKQLSRYLFAIDRDGAQRDHA